MDRYLLLKYGKWIAVSVFILLVLIIFFIGLGTHSSAVKKCPTTASHLTVAEKKTQLANFLAKVKEAKFVLQPHRGVDDMILQSNPEAILKKFLPYDCKPETIKLRTDIARQLYEESIELKKKISDVFNEKELKTMAKLQYYLDTNFGSPYDEDYYAGDWMLGPDAECWQPFCNIPEDLVDYFGVADDAFRPRSNEGVKSVIETLEKYEASILQYIENMKIGIKAGMVRSQSSKDSSISTLREKFPMVVTKGKEGVLEEEYVTTLRSSDFLGNLDQATVEAWHSEYGMLPNKSIDDALVNHLGSSLERLHIYIRDEYFHHCPPNSVVSGMSDLPVDFIWVNSTEDRNAPTTKRLPSGEAIDGKESYKRILKYFTTFDITPEQIHKIGKENLERSYSIKTDILMEITGKSTPDEAEKQFQKSADKIYYNVDPFPHNETQEFAFKCVGEDETASKLYCPQRYAKMKEWIEDTRAASQLIRVKTRPLFFFTGDFTTISNCPVEIKADPFVDSPVYHQTDAECTDKPCEYTLPFFEMKYGPKFNTFSSLIQSAGPGFHTLNRALLEHFPADHKLEGDENIEWLDDEMDKMTYAYGWMEYIDFVVMAMQSDLYENNALQKYGRIRHAIEAALRLVIDTGVHYLGMTHEEATSLWSKHSGEIINNQIEAEENIGHIENRPGLATGHHLGSYMFWKVRNSTQTRLETSGYIFDIRDYHYNVLQLGVAPLAYLEEYMKRITECNFNIEHHPNCIEIFGDAPHQESWNKMKSRQRASKAKRNHYVRNEM